MKRSRLFPSVVGALLLGLCMRPDVAAALALGEPQLESRYGQPLRLRVPVELGTEDELSDAGLVQARLMGEDYYETRGVALPEIPPAELTIRTERVDGRIWVWVASDRALREPMLTLFVNIRLGASQITREVPVLLDFQGRALTTASPPAAAAAIDSLALPARATGSATGSATAAPVEPAAVAQAPVAPRKPRRRRVERSPAPEAPPESSPPVPTAVAPAGLQMDSVLSRPDGYRRFRLDETFASARLAAPLPAPAAPVAGADDAELAPPVETSSAGVGWSWLLLLALPAGYLLLRNRARPAVVPSAPALLISAATFQPAPATEPAPKAEPQRVPTLVGSDPAIEPHPESSPREPIAFTELPPSPGLPTEGYPHQDLRERVTQLSRQTSTPTDKRKLELVKAYIDVERPESAEKLLAELEEKHHSSSRPGLLDFELS